MKLLKKIIFPLIFLFTASCELSNDIAAELSKYNTSLELTVTATPADDAYYDNDKYKIIFTPSEEGLTINYTTDGSDPSRTAGTEYTSPVIIDEPAYTAGTTYTIKAVLFDDNRISEIAQTTASLGNGSFANPYEIATAAQLRNIYTNVNAGTDTTACFLQIANISLSAYASWDPIGNNITYNFGGIFDGGNFSIEGLTINSSADHQGLFGYLTGGTLQNIRLQNVNITAKLYAGSLAGFITTTSTINNCIVSGTNLINGEESVGGLIGFTQNSSVSNCTVTATVAGITGVKNSIGGLVGTSNKTNIDHCNTNVTVNGNIYIGGLAGNAYRDAPGTESIAWCNSAGVINGTSSVGGLVGNTGGPMGSQEGVLIVNSTSGAAVNGSTSTGGLVGSIIYSGEITSCHASGTVTGTTQRIGGLAGSIGYSPVITNSHAIGFVNAPTADRVGGFAGQNNNGSTITPGNYATGNVIGLNYVGGFVGYNTNIIGINNYATGNVSGANNVGGFAGYNSQSITNCWHITGTVTGTGSNTGGFAGINDLTGIITRCYATGAGIITGNSSVGGLVGNNASGGKINLSCAKVNVTAAINAGGLVGTNGPANSEISNCYARGNVSGTSSGGLVGNNLNGSDILYSYSTGAAGTAGLIGSDDFTGSTFTSLFWDTQSSLNATSGALTPWTSGELTTAMKNINTYMVTPPNPWDFAINWTFTAGKNNNYPHLKWEPAGL